MSIDYARQFVSLGEVEFLTLHVEMRARGMKRPRAYDTAKQAFESARRSEERYGLDVVFAENAGTFYVWAGVMKR
jgi:hypothetical protein